MSGVTVPSHTLLWEHFLWAGVLGVSRVAYTGHMSGRGDEQLAVLRRVGLTVHDSEAAHPLTGMRAADRIADVVVARTYANCSSGRQESLGKFTSG